jgi:hypothetical protein
MNFDFSLHETSTVVGLQQAVTGMLLLTDVWHFFTCDYEMQTNGQIGFQSD